MKRTLIREPLPRWLYWANVIGWTLLLIWALSSFYGVKS